MYCLTESGLVRAADQSGLSCEKALIQPLRSWRAMTMRWTWLVPS